MFIPEDENVDSINRPAGRPPVRVAPAVPFRRPDELRFPRRLRVGRQRREGAVRRACGRTVFGFCEAHGKNAGFSLHRFFPQFVLFSVPSASLAFRGRTRVSTHVGTFRARDYDVGHTVTVRGGRYRGGNRPVRASRAPRPTHCERSPFTAYRLPACRALHATHTHTHAPARIAVEEVRVRATRLTHAQTHTNTRAHTFGVRSTRSSGQYPAAVLRVWDAVRLSVSARSETPARSTPTAAADTTIYSAFILSRHSIYDLGTIINYCCNDTRTTAVTI